MRFLRLDLTWGCHERSFDFHDHARPVIICGPNGAGKSTLLEGLVRTLFGFNRRTGADARELTWREPWSRVPARGRLELRDGAGAVTTVAREFSTNEVVIATGGAVETWNGDGNPAATNASACDWRQRLRDLVGFDRLESYERTAFVRQGGLLATRVDESLLRAAAGSPVDVERALAAIEQAHRRFTCEAVGPDRSRAQKARERELAERSLAELERALDEARALERERGPLVADEERLRRAHDEAARAIATLETALVALVRRETLSAEIARIEERIAVREHELAEIERCRAEVAAVRLRAEELGEPPALPDDFPERAAALEQLWASRDRAALRSRDARAALDALRVAHRAWVLPGSVLAAGGALAWIVSHEPLWVVAVAAGLVALAAAWRARRTSLARRESSAAALERVEGECTEIDHAIEAQLQPIPVAVGLTRESLAQRRESFLRHRAVRSASARAAEAYETALARVAGDRAADLGQPDTAVERLRESLARERNRLAEQRWRLEEVGRAVPDLPEGVRDEASAVERALDARRRERAAAEHERTSVMERLAQRRPTRAPVAIEEELAAARARLAEIEEIAEAHRAAWSLLDEAHRGFREEDQRRLVDRISAHLLQLSGGELGPLVVPGSLDAARLHAFGRDVPLDHRPLSYGQLHLVLLAVRLGAADFMARWGTAIPLLVDEPFAALDDDNAAAVWQQLGTIAASRQVVIATQESGLLERLGIRADVTLSARKAPAASPPRLA